MSASSTPKQPRQARWVKILVGALIVVAIAAASFLFGRYAATQVAMQERQLREEALAGARALTSYRSAADIAIHVRAGNYVKAQCTAELVASIMLTELRACLANSSCRYIVIDHVQRDAPEVLAPDAELGFRVYVPGELCPPVTERQRRVTLAMRRWGFAPFCAACPARHAVVARLARTLGVTSAHIQVPAPMERGVGLQRTRRHVRARTANGSSLRISPIRGNVEGQGT
eukprot:gene18225-25638_t